MSFPLVNSGTSQSETLTLAADGSYQSVSLTYRARGQEVLSSGAISPSTIVVTRGGVTYTEVFSLPISTGDYFYHEDDATNETSKLLFHSDQSGDVSVSYTTRGSIVQASYFNMWTGDVPKAILSGLVASASWSTIAVNGGTSVYGTSIDTSAYTSDASLAIVQVTVGMNDATGDAAGTGLVGSSFKNVTGYDATDVIVGTLSDPTGLSDLELYYTITIPSTSPDPA